MIEVNAQTIVEFTKLLIECGGVYEVQSDYTINNKLTGEKVMIVEAKDAKPLAIFHEGASTYENVKWLNPFKESLGGSKERDWFFNLICNISGMITKYVIHKIIEDGVKKKDDSYGSFALMAKIHDKVDETMLGEIEKLTSNALVSIYYNKREKVAEAQTELFSKELHDAFPKFRKKSWEVFQLIFQEIFGSDDLSEYKYRAKILDIPETEAKLAVAIALISHLGPFAKDFLGKDLHEAELNAHFEVLEGYSKLYAWATVSNDTQKSTAAPSVMPWAAPAPYPVMPTAPVYGTPAPMPIAPSSATTETGAIKMSSYGGIAVPITNDMYQSFGYNNMNPNLPQTARGLFGQPVR